LSKVHLRQPLVATFEEIEMAKRDQRHVPMLVSAMWAFGQLGGRDQADVDEHRKNLALAHGPQTDKAEEFFDEIRGDERASLPLLVRAMATLRELAAVYDELKARIEAGPIDRWVWLTMREIANLETEYMTFRTEWDSGTWYTWATQLAPTNERNDGDRFFWGSKQVFKFTDFDKMMEVCPIAASFPLEPPMGSQELLGRGVLAGRFAMHPTHYNTNCYRTLSPVWTSTYDAGMRELFPPGTKPPPMPVAPSFPQPQPSTLGKDPVRILLARQYESYIDLYTDGSPAGSSMLIIQWMKQLHKAVFERNQKRVWELEDMHDRWEEKGWLDMTAENTGLAANDIARRHDDHQTATRRSTPEPEEFVKDRSTRKRRREDLRELLGKKKLKRSDIFYRDGAGVVRDRDGKAYPQAPMGDAPVGPYGEDGGEQDEQDEQEEGDEQEAMEVDG
jgi:hypothetical protein